MTNDNNKHTIKMKLIEHDKFLLNMLLLYHQVRFQLYVILHPPILMLINQTDIFHLKNF